MNFLKIVGGPDVRTLQILDNRGLPIKGIRSIIIDKIDVESACIVATVEMEAELDINVEIKKNDSD